MEDYSADDHPIEREEENLLMTSKHPHLSHFFGDDSKTPNSLPSAGVSMEDSAQFHDVEDNVPDYRLFEEQSYVPDLSPSNQVGPDNGANSKNVSEIAGSSARKVGTTQRKRLPGRRSGPAKVKPFLCKEPGCEKSYTEARALRKHIANIHANHINDTCETSDVDLTGKADAVGTRTNAQGFASVGSILEQPSGYQPANASPGIVVPVNGPSFVQTSSSSDVDLAQGNESEVVENGTFVRQKDSDHFNMQLLAQAMQNQSSQLNPGEQQGNRNQQSEFLQHQSSRALQQLAISIQMRSSTYPNADETLISSSSPAPMLGITSDVPAKRRFISTMPGQITGVRAQLRKSLSSNGKLENVNAAGGAEWQRISMAVGGGGAGGMNHGNGGHGFFHVGMQSENNPANIDDAPMLKNLLATPKPTARLSSSEGANYLQENALPSANVGYPASLENSWPSDVHNQGSSGDLCSPILVSKRNEFQYHRSMSDIPELQQNSNPSPLHSPSYAGGPQFTIPLPQQHNQTTPLPHSEQQFFSPNDIMVNNNNNQEMGAGDESSEKLSEMIIESENLVQDLMDEEEASSNQGQAQQQLIGYAENAQAMDGTGQMTVARVTPPPAYHLDPNTGAVHADVIQNSLANPAAPQTYMGRNRFVKSEPQSPMIMSPVAQRSFFGAQGPMGVHSGGMQPLASPTTPHHQVPMQPGMHSQAAETNWQYPMGGQAQNYGSVPQSPVNQSAATPLTVGQTGQDLRTSNFLPQARQTGAGNSKPARARRTSGGSARKNPDGTLSCTICGHSFRSVPALNGHMRVHSSSADKKTKDERNRKTSGSSSGGNESRTPQTLSSPTTPTLNKINQPTSMYQNTAAFNSVTLPAYTNPNALYNPSLSTMDGAGAVLPMTAQNVSPRDAALVHRINPQTGLYPYALQHATQMQPHDALIAAANLLARSDQDLFMRSPGSGNEEYPTQIPANLQQLLGQQQAAGYRGTPSSSVILVPQQGTVVPSYFAREGDHMQGVNPTSLPFVTIPLTSGMPPTGRQTFASSPPQEQAQHVAPALENIQYIQQSLNQQASNRSTPLADFADIAVLHDQGQLFTNNSMLMAPLGVQNPNQQQEEVVQRIQQQQQTQRQPTEQMPLQGVPDVSLLPSDAKDFIWASDTQQQLVKEERDGVVPLKTNEFAPSSMVRIQMPKSAEPNQHSRPDPFIFPVSIPVQCSRDEATPVTSTLHHYYQQHPSSAFSNNMSAFHDDPMVQESINVANPSTILPNSMMGGNPSGFRSIRQRHHSEGSMLKKTWQINVHAAKDEMKALNPDQMPGFSVLETKPDPPGLNSTNSGSILPVPVPGSKRKVGSASGSREAKEIKTEFQSENRIVPVVTQTSDANKEIWTVPKNAPPNRLRHRRHSADSRLQYRSGPLFSRSAYLSSMQMAGKNAPRRGALGTPESRGKRRPPPLIIPPSVNTFATGTLYMSQLHHRRRPSGDSGSNCGDEKIPPYTPPPMLSPARCGTGLYSCTPSIKPVYRQASGEPAVITTIPEEDVDEELLRSADPKINIGADYQAELPDLCPRWKLKRQIHKADLVWKPAVEIQTDDSMQARHVEEYLRLACSAAVPYGGCNKEFALHLLHENKGDILASVRELLSTKVTVARDHWMASYNYLGSVTWSSKERQIFDQEIAQYNKDFYNIAKMIGTKTTAQCVDYYYHTAKRRKRRIQRPRRFRRDSEEEDAPVLFSPSPKDSEAQPLFQGHVAASPESSVTFKEEQREPRAAEVVCRSPPVTTFIRVPPIQASRVATGPAQAPTPPSVIERAASAAAQRIPQIHSYARQPVTVPLRQPVLDVRTFPVAQFQCKTANCNQSFPTVQLFQQHQLTHNLKPYIERMHASPSPANSPSADGEVKQFQCPRCGKTFGKVKSRNAHMKTHGKLAQEKRRQKEEEARRKTEESAAWRNRQRMQQQQQQQQQQLLIHRSPGNGRELIQFQTVQSPLTQAPGI